MSAMDNDSNIAPVENPLSWLKRKENFEKFSSRTCHIYNNLSRQGEENSVCPCGRLVRRHSFKGACLRCWGTLAPSGLDFTKEHSKEVKLNTWGIYPSGCKYLRCDYNTKIKDIYDLIVEDCGGKKPPFIISVYGGAKYFSLSDRLEKEFMRGIIQTATTADAWIVTAGINNGVSKLVGEGISQYNLLKKSSREVICIGLTMWGSVGEQTRLELRKNSVNWIGLNGLVVAVSSDTPNPNIPMNWLAKQTLANTNEDNKNMLEVNHTHCILFDNGRMFDYLDDGQRSELVTLACSDPHNPCYGVTIIVEGGLGTLEVLENDIENKRPIVLIQGSGRIADVISNLLELTTNVGQNQQRDPTEKEIENAYLDKFSNYPLDELSVPVNRIAALLKAENRYFLNVFRLDRDINVAETIFKAIFKAINYIQQQNPSENPSQDYNWTLANLSLKWNYFDGGKQIIESSSHINKHKQRAIIQDFTKTRILFLKSLKLNRHEFVDYFIRSGFDPRNLSYSYNINQCQQAIVDLYKMKLDSNNENHSCRVIPMFGSSNTIESIQSLNKKIKKLLGSFVYPIYVHTGRNKSSSVLIPVDNHLRFDSFSEQDLENNGNDQINSSTDVTNESSPLCSPHRKKEDIYSEQEMIRDLFLWSVFMDLPQISKVLLANLRPRICGALIASAIFKQYSAISQNIDFKQKMKIQADDFEFYAARCVDQCYDYNNRTGCELLLRRIPLFGKVTCMQVAISSGTVKIFETACFDHALNQVWCNKLDLSNLCLQAKPRLALSVLLCGLSAPSLLEYSPEDDRSDHDKKTKFELSSQGINYYSEKETKKSSKWSKFWKKFIYFHQSPIVRMSYHFISYIWFLLVFSYMMLYHFDLPSEGTRVHWTEIYVIITISTMLIEEFRRRIFQSRNRLVETSGSSSNILPFISYVFYIAPYPLFYLGIGFRYSSGTNRNLLTTARILMAFDLELWYLRSLRFVIGLKYLGPKLFMLKNMLRDMFAFIYMIFVAIAAYGVVSRALVLYKEVSFNAHGIFRQIIYPPYWFIHGDVSDRNMLENIIQNVTSIKAVEATATHILLAFHMLFINILLLNLLIAVFADSIGKVQQNTDYYWRYQRYSFVREYFQQPYFAYPPLVIFSQIYLLIHDIYQIIKKKCCQPNKDSDANNPETNQEDMKSPLSIFKLIPVDGPSLDEYWYMFESAATLSYARSIIEKKKQLSSGLSGNRDLIDGISDEQRTISTNFNLSSTNADENRSSNLDTQNTIDYLKEELSGIRSTLTEVQTQLSQRNATVENLRTSIDQMAESMKTMMNAKTPEEMSNEQQPTN